MSIRVVVDTNIYYQALYNPQSKQMRLLEAALEERAELCSPYSVKQEIARVLKKAGFDKTTELVESLPVKWVEFELYSRHLPEASKLISHKPDEHVVACALLLDCGILSANTRHFNNKRLRKKIKLWNLVELLEQILQANKD